METHGNINTPIQSEAHTLAELKKTSRWLSDFAGNVYSQEGEDGVIEKALGLLPSRTRWCVEFGAWDGKYLSNTFRLVEQEGYKVVLIEGDTKKYRALCRVSIQRTRNFQELLCRMVRERRP